VHFGELLKSWTESSSTIHSSGYNYSAGTRYDTYNGFVIGLLCKDIMKFYDHINHLVIKPDVFPA